MKVLNQKSSVCKVANVAKLGVVSALIGAGLFFSACGGDTQSKAETFVKEKYPDAQILTFEEAKKEFGFTKGKDCLVKKGDTFLTTYHFIKTSSGEIETVAVSVIVENGDLYEIKNAHYSVDSLKILIPCF